MQTYRLTFELASPGLTPWQADTLFGHFCWALARRAGDEAVQNLLARCRDGDPPLLLSDGFPPDAFPRPLLPPLTPPAGDAAPLAEQVEAMRQGKAARERKWLSAAQFRQVLRGETAPPPGPPASRGGMPEAQERPFATLHNRIDRLTGTTPAAEEGTTEGVGGLFALEGTFAPARVVYARVADEVGFDWQTLFKEDIQQTGFGKRKSVGYGAIRRVEIEPFDDFGEPEDADGFVSLSAFVPAKDDPTDGGWRADVKFGKLGEERAVGPNPFKRPLVRLLAGAAFRTNGPPRPFYGRLVDGVAPAASDAAQYGFAFAVGLRWHEEPL